MADGVTTTTKYLANKIRAYNKNVIVIPNSLDPNKIKINKIASESVRLGWAGGSSHHEDIKLLKNIGIGSKFNARNVQFLLAGFNTNIRTSDNKIIDAFDLSIWKKYEEIITKDYSIVSDGYKQHLLNPNKNKKYFNEDNEKYRRIWTQSIAKYLKIMNEIDIFIVPLANNEFNGLKSELKLIEAGFYRVPVIASSVQQYSDIINHGENGFLVEEKKSHKDFTKFIKVYLNNPNLMNDHAEKLHELCLKDFNLKHNSLKRLEFYNSL